MSELIAEVANVHEGDCNYLGDLCMQLSTSAIMYVKFQFIIAEEFGLKGCVAYDTFKKLEIPISTYHSILTILSNKQVLFDVFGRESLKNVVNLKKKYTNIVGLKIHTTNALDFGLILECLKHFESIFISISGVTAIELTGLVTFLQEHDYLNRIILCYGIQNYPTSPENTKLNKLAEIKRLFGLRVCLTDHLNGRTKLSETVVYCAEALGYDFIEKHVTLDSKGTSRDNLSAFEVADLISLHEELLAVQRLSVNNVLSLSDAENAYSKEHKNIAYARIPINKGETIHQTQLLSGRQNNLPGLYYPNLHEIINKVASRDIEEGEAIVYSDCDRKVNAMIIVRAASERFPGKCFELVGGVEALRFLIKRVKNSKCLNSILVCTSENKEDDRIVEIAESENVPYTRGSSNVYQRIEKAFQVTGRPDIFLRLTGDNIFVDPQRIDAVIPPFVNGYFDYYRDKNVFSGFGFEVIRIEAYESLRYFFSDFMKNAEYMTLYLENSFFRTMPPLPGASEIDPSSYRFTLDYPEDLDNIRTVCNNLNNMVFTYDEFCSLLRNNGITYKHFQPVDKSISIKPVKGCLF